MDRHRTRRRVWALPAILLAFVGVLATLYAADPAWYHAILLPWGFRSFHYPFLDTATLISQIRCSHRVDVYVSNACVILGVPFDYSPLWLRVGFLARAQDWSMWIGVSGVLSFAAALTVLPPARSLGHAWLMVLGVLSPLSLFALERGNADVLIFVLMALALVLLDRNYAGRSLGYTTIVAAAMLKFYPLVVLLPMLRERPRRLAAGLAAVGGVLAGFVAVFGREILRALAKIPHPAPFDDGFGAVQFPAGLAMMLKTADAAPIVEGLLVAIAIAVAARVALMPAFDRALGTLSRREQTCLLAGALLVVVCFFGGANIGYRGILLLFALPGLLALSCCRPLGVMVRASPFVALLSMWNLMPLGLVGPHGLWFAISGPAPFFSVWLCREVLWWWTATVLLAVILHEVLQSCRFQQSVLQAGGLLAGDDPLPGDLGLGAGRRSWDHGTDASPAWPSSISSLASHIRHMFWEKKHVVRRLHR